MESGFFDKVFDVVRQIPYGRISTYGIIAKHIGSPQAARMVGWALNKSGNEKEFVPAHRVVNRKGVLTGKHHFANQNTMHEMLENEGVIITDDQIQNFEDLLWYPKVYP
ncbi:MAG: MGMT family protein [Bacteroidota bacterium]